MSSMDVANIAIVSLMECNLNNAMYKAGMIVIDEITSPNAGMINPTIGSKKNHHIFWRNT